MSTDKKEHGYLDLSLHASPLDSEMGWVCGMCDVGPVPAVIRITLRGSGDDDANELQLCPSCAHSFFKSLTATIAGLNGICESLKAATPPEDRT